jgi:outer membrane receptor protein involved in Fe transport
MKTQSSFPFAVALAAGLLLGALQPAFAQETTGTLTGHVIDAQGLAVPGAKITITGGQGVKSVTSDAQGRFSVPFLTPGAYTVRAEKNGFAPAEQKNVAVSIGTPIDVSVKLELETVSENVNVTTGGEVISTTSTTTGATLTSDQLQQVPIGRTVSDTLYMAPGVSSSSTAGHANPSIAGGTGLDNQYVIDGANVTNMGYGALGSYSIVFGSLGQATPFDFIQEVQVKTGGYQAEFGQATGGVVNVVTKSGTNTVSGSAFAYGRPSGLEANWTQFQSTNGSVQTESTHSADGGVEGGGPLMRNKLFFFGAYDPSRSVLTLQAPAGFPLQSLGNVDQVRTSKTYSTKLTWQINPTNRIDASFFGDPSTGEMGPQRLSALLVTDTSSFSSLQYGGHNQTVSYHGVLNSRLLAETTYAHSLNRIAETPSVNSWQVTDNTVTPTVTTGGIGFYEAGNRSVNDQYSGKMTYLSGHHEVKFGGEFDNVNYSQINQYTGPTFVAADGRTTATGATITILPDVNFGQIYEVSRAAFNSGRVTTQHYGNLFVQDTWRVGSRLTVEPGLRYEQETLNGTLVSGFTLKNNWAPRLGATYMATADGLTKIYGNYGRYYSRVPNDLAARSLSADDGISRADYFDAGLTQPIPNGVVTQVPDGGEITNHFVLSGASPDTIDLNAKLGYTNEYVAGIERQIFKATSLDVRYIFRNIPRILEDVADAPIVAYEQGLPGTDSVEYILTNPTSQTPILASAASLGASFVDPVHTYNAVEVTLNHQGDKWTALASYRWSRLRGNYEGFYRDDNGQSDPGISSLYDFPTNDPSYTSIGVPQFGFSGDIRYLGQVGVLPLDRPEQGKFFGSYRFSDGLNLGVSVNLSSGAPLTALAANPIYTNGGEIPETVRGAGIQTVDGFMTRTPFLTQVDLQASYDLRFGKTAKLTLLANAFNLFNTQTVLAYDQWTELSFGVPNPDFGKPETQVLFGHPPQFQAPFAFRVGARFRF